MEAAPRFLQGVFPFKGSGLDKPMPLDGKLAYTVPSDKRA
ncbi:MAG: molybdopterin oxidoreductase, partial [Xanthobacteraceae bacterium]|nr:molybdopterin oxidoreductase [Xanthobacteraceae bacterium]